MLPAGDDDSLADGVGALVLAKDEEPGHGAGAADGGRVIFANTFQGECGYEGRPCLYVSVWLSHREQLKEFYQVSMAEAPPLVLPQDHGSRSIPVVADTCTMEFLQGLHVAYAARLEPLDPVPADCETTVPAKPVIWGLWVTPGTRPLPEAESIGDFVEAYLDRREREILSGPNLRPMSELAVKK